MNTTFLFEDDFEMAVDKQLKDLSFNTSRSIYIDLGELKSQIDILAYKNGVLFCIECKSMIAWKMDFSRYRKTWVYLGDDGLERSIHSPYIQNKNHILVVEKYLSMQEGYNRWVNFYNEGLPIIQNICVFKDTLDLSELKDSSRVSTGVFRISDLILIDKLYKQKNKALADLSQIAYNYLNNLSDISEEAKQKHKNYIYKCKKEKLGFFNPEAPCIVTT